MDQFVTVSLNQFCRMRAKWASSASSLSTKKHASANKQTEANTIAPISENDKTINETESNNAVTESEAASTENNEENIPQGLNRKGLPLYEFLKTKTPEIDWNENLELLLRGSLIPNTNIYELIKDATSTDGSISSDEASWRVFRKWLQDNDVPNNLVNNKVKKSENLPPVENPPKSSEFPSVEHLKDRYKEGLGPIVQQLQEDQEPVKKKNKKKLVKT